MKELPEPFAALRVKLMIRKAQLYLAKGQPIPLTLYAELLEQGVDVSEIR